ncbi:DNA excision repair protein ERCC-like-like protein [Hapsidospora chrysogenum ATCC 11550]|uniref:DNA excision repair protein ERCC-like-like protein n=1 Tax=Hapsidospora chrysogenum (strain ATCC 11550 / CBS 779.69 / DSM 880 / IAM 14645 / JCM 23072 / IMI 49137) TaxID=857340 RepID=A0A086T996_HAPC1|nr:DNA excision repair protein ERCC-like-like protein [Hapsidospora chrysogenum ATCC 11550]
MAARARKYTINLIDDDGTDSESDDGVRAESTRKRKLQADFSEKVQWTDESDSAPVKPKKRRAKRKSAGKKRSSAHADEDGAGDEDSELFGIPEYLQDRRRQFDENKKLHHEAALMLPPDYTGIIFDETRRLGDLEERPKFDEKSGVKPCRPYEDIELPQSGGFIPASIARYLRDYQVDGVRFLHRKFVYQEGAILGDDMGLGKTVQVAAFLTAAFGKTGDERDSKRMRQMRYRNDRWYPRILIICPGSLIMNWRNELDRWGWWHTDLFHGANKEDVLGTARAGLLEVMITTYDTYKNSRSSINMVQWDAVIADECHRLKDRSSETTRAMLELNALCRVGLTGTAIQNRYEELWTLLDWTNPGHFGTMAEWNETVSRPLAVGQSHEATMAQLSLARQTARKLVENLLPRYFLRRMKTLIAHQLPKKTDRVVFCPLTNLQREAYENFLGSADIGLLRSISDECEHGNASGWCCRKLTSSGKPWQNIVFPSMIVLQKLANHLTLLVPQMTDLEQKQESELRALQVCAPDIWQELYSQRDQIRSLVNPEFCGKWKVLRKLLRFWHSSNDKVLVFSHSVRLLRILQHLFHNTSYNVSYLDGSLSYEARQDVVDTFNSDPTQFVFLISTRAGGVGLNITSANKVVIVDPHWNPSYDLQAQDRAYRIGQTRDVEVFRLISLGTVEEVVYARQIYKQQQANIGYTASSERRYFRGVQQDTERKGEIFGLANIFTYHTDSGLLRDIVNKTNIAEAKAGVTLADVDMEKAAEEDEKMGIVKKEDGEGDGGMSQLADLLKAEDQKQVIESRKASTPKTDPIQAILTSAGVEYTHDNSEVIGSSKVEEQLSRRAAMGNYAAGDMQGQNALFADDKDDGNDEAVHSRYNPPEDVQLRQFCEMAREFGFANATDFALVVESWTQEERRGCLDAFYRKREARLLKQEATKNGLSDDAKVGDLKSENVKREDGLPYEKGEDVKSEAEDKQSTIKPRVKAGASEIDKSDVKKEETTPKDEKDDKMRIKVEGKSKRTSIFLSDDDEDDEL